MSEQSEVASEVVPPASGSDVESIPTSIAEYSELAAGLAAMRARLKDVVYDLTTTKGNEAARRDRKMLVSTRTALEQRRKDLNEADRERIEKRNAEAKRLIGLVLEFEKPIDDDIKADEERREKERAEKQRLEEERIAGHQLRIEEMRGMAIAAIRQPSAAIDKMIAELEAFTDFKPFEEYATAAARAQTETLGTLRDLREASFKAEEAARKQEADRVELERLRKESAEREAREAEERRVEQARIAEANRIEQARLQAEAQRLADEEKARKAEAERLEAEAAERRRAADAEAQRQRDEADRIAREERERVQAAEKATRRAWQEIQAMQAAAFPPASASTSDIADALAAAMAWPVDSFGDLMGPASAAKTLTVETLRVVLGARHRADEEEAERKRVADAAEAQQRAAEEATGKAAVTLENRTGEQVQVERSGAGDVVVTTGEADVEPAPIEVQLSACRAALTDALQLLEGWIEKKCPKKLVAEHMAHVATLRVQGGLPPVV